MKDRSLSLPEATLEPGKLAILQTAMRLFARNGFHKTSTATICKAAGVSSGLLFYHFGNKDGLLTAIIDYVLSKLTYILADGQTVGTPLSQLEGIIDRFAASLRDDLPFWELYISILYQPDTKPMIYEKIEEASRVFRRRVYELFGALGDSDPGRASYEFEIFRVGLFASYLANRREDLLNKSIVIWKERFIKPYRS